MPAFRNDASRRRSNSGNRSSWIIPNSNTALIGSCRVNASVPREARQSLTWLTEGSRIDRATSEEMSIVAGATATETA